MFQVVGVDVTELERWGLSQTGNDLSLEGDSPLPTFHAVYSHMSPHSMTGVVLHRRCESLHTEYQVLPGARHAYCFGMSLLLRRPALGLGVLELRS